MIAARQFRRKAETVTAIQFDGTNAEECGRLVDHSAERIAALVKVGDWLVMDKGFIAQLQPEKFNERYEPLPARSEWVTIETAPRDGTPVLFWFEKAIQKTHVHSGFILPNISIIGGRFSFDMPKALWWRPMPSDPSPGDAR